MEVSWEVGGYPLSIALENGAEDDKMQILAKANTAEFGKKVTDNNYHSNISRWK